MAEKPRTVKVYAHLTLIEAGKYKPVTLVPQWSDGNSIMVAVDVPITPDTIDNLEDVLKEEVNGNLIKAVFTAKGLRVLLDQYQSALDDEQSLYEESSQVDKQPDVEEVIFID